MNWDQIAGKWEQFKGLMKQRWGKLTDDDLDVADGARERLEGMLQEAYGYTEERAQQEVEEFMRRAAEGGADEEDPTVVDDD